MNAKSKTAQARTEPADVGQPGDASGPLVVQRVEVENYERCRLARFKMRPAGATKLKGRNKAGKSSVGNALRDLLAGATRPEFDKAMTVTEPIRAGEKEARVEVEIVDLTGKAVLVADVVHTRKGRYLHVRPIKEDGRPGIPLGEPASVLRRLFGALGVLDPYDFVRMPARQQVEAFLRLVEFPDVSDDLARLEIFPAEGQALPDALEDERKRTFDYRTEVNRNLKQQQAELAGVHLPQGWRTLQPVDVQALLAKQGELLTQQRAKQVAVHAVRQTEQVQAQTAQAVAAAERALAVAQSALKAAQENHKRAVAAVGEALTEAEKLAEPAVELEQVNEKLRQTETINTTCREVERSKQLTARVKETESEAEGLTERLNAILALKARLVTEAKSPLPGLAYSPDTGVTYNDVPLAQASDSEKVLIGASIAHAQDPRLRWLRVPGSLYESMDDETAAGFEATLAEWGMQALCEVVLRGDGKPGELVIEDGVLEAEDAM